MSDTAIDKMNDKQLRAEVQALRDELAIFKRKYEDMIYNLDSDNFGRSFKVEQNNMKAQVKVTAEAIETVMSATTVLGDKLDSNIKQTADLIESSVSIEDVETELKKYSIISQTADTIKSVVNSGYVTELIGDTYQTTAGLGAILEEYSTRTQTASDITDALSKTYVTSLLGIENYYTRDGANKAISDSATNILAQVDTKITTSASGIKADIGKVYKTIEDANDEYGVLEGMIAGAEGRIASLKTTVEANAEGLTTVVGKNISAHFESDVAPNQITTTALQKSILCLYKGVYYYYDDDANLWKEYPIGGIKTMFKQTSAGFEFTGDVTIRGGGNNLYIGEQDEYAEKSIVFNGDNARITSVLDGSYDYNGLEIQASSLQLAQRADRIWLYDAPESGSVKLVTLEDYVESVAPIAVFG